jgi:hypothetical protein
MTFSAATKYVNDFILLYQIDDPIVFVNYFPNQIIVHFGHLPSNFWKKLQIVGVLPYFSNCDFGVFN